MTDHYKNTTANLEFFRSAVLGPALQSQSFFDYDTDSPRVTFSDASQSFLEEGSPVSDFGAIEAAHWAWLGAQIGYFDANDVRELILSSKGIFKAWANLKNRRLLSPEDRWARIVRAEETEQGAMVNNSAFRATLIGPETRELLQSTFQNFLLLTAENILDLDSIYFLDSIGWAADGEWNLRKRSGSVRRIGSGFANVLNYWEEMNSSSLSAEDRDAEDRGVPPDEFPSKMGTRTTITFSEGFANDEVVRNFCEDARAILSRRFNLVNKKVVGRYFELAGEFANRAGDDSPEWLDAVKDAFTSLRQLLIYAGGWYNLLGKTVQHWNLFMGEIESPPPENEIRPAKSSEEKPKVAPPEESA